MALAQVGGAGRGRRLIVVLEDRLLRESLAMALAEEGFRPLEFARADAALAHIEAGSDVDALIVDAATPGNHDRPRDRLRAARCASPVFLLSGHGEALAAADTWGAAGVIDRTQPLANLKRNLVNAIRASILLAAPAASGVASRAASGAASGAVLSQGPLVRRLRKKFREVDPDFDQIVFVPGCGYGWRDGDAPPR